MADLRPSQLTVVIPCHNVAATLPEQLDALMSQVWDRPWDIIVVDNNSSDDLDGVLDRHADGPIPMRRIRATSGQNVAYARNAGIRAAVAPWVAICDGDDVVQPGWIAALGGALDANRLVGGTVDPSLVNEAWLARTRPLGTPGALPRFGGAPFVSGGNCAMHRDLWVEVGGYDEDFRGLEDIDFSLRARSVGADPAHAPSAVIGYRYREGLGPLWRQGFFYGRGRRELTRRARAFGLRGASPVAALKSWLWLLWRLPELATRAGRYRWVWVLANRIGAVRGLFDVRQPVPGQAQPTIDSSSAYHGVLITYRRAADLRSTLGVLSQQSLRLDSLTVVDNDADPSIRELVGLVAPAASYLAMPENLGPSGGIHHGVHDVLRTAPDHDWVVLLDDDDPPVRLDAFERLRELLETTHAQDARCAGLGLWGAKLNRRTGRLRAATGSEPESVDYLPGGACPHYSVGALRRAGLPEPELFFGFDDLDLGLRLKRTGYSLYSSGEARRHQLEHMVDGRRATPRVVAPTWRRYYSLRNLIVVLRSSGFTQAAVVMSVAAGILKPMLNFARRPRLALRNLRLNVRAIHDGWRGRLGRTIEPGEEVP